MPICRSLQLIAVIFSVCAASPIVFPGVAEALFAMVETEAVPVQRLIENLERERAKDPKNADVLFALARTHSLAYAQKGGQVDALKSGGPSGQGLRPSFYPGSNNIAFEVKPETDAAKIAAAKNHLNTAIALYRELVAVAPENLVARLGLAWSLDQSGDKLAAIAEYRAVIAAAWQKEKDVAHAGPGSPFLADEAGTYLKALLNPVADAPELADIEAKHKHFASLPRMVTPIAIPLDNEASLEDLVVRNHPVRFDLDGTGRSQCAQWISPRAAWLVYSPEFRPVSSSLQLFGNNTFWIFWKTGYEALASLDDNADGELSGKELRSLALWHDKNSNGVSEPGEIAPLSLYGISALSTRYEKLSDGTPASRNGVRLDDGSTRNSYDLILETKPVGNELGC